MGRRVRHFNPAQAGAQIVLDARFIAGVADGAALATWPSRSVAAINATASGANQPTFRVSALNGNAAVEFDGNSDFMSFASGALSITNNVGSASINCVVAEDASSTDATIYAVYFSNGTATGSPRAGLHTRLSGVSSIRAQGRRLDADAASTSVSAGTASSPCVATARFDWANNQMQTGVNGAFAATTTFASGAGNTSATNSLRARIGALDAITNRFGGRLAAVVVSSPMLSDAMARRLRAHLGYSFRIRTL